MMAKRIVVMGGGFAGAYCAKTLEKSFDVTLIDSKDYFEFTPSVLRTLVDPSNTGKIQALHSHYLKRARFLKGEVTRIDDSHVIAGRRRIPYDYLIITSGSTYARPIKEKGMVLSMRADTLRKYHHKLLEAESVLIVGGGLVGIELAAEIITHFPEKKVTLLHSHDRLLPRNTMKAATRVKEFLERHGVSLVLNERLSSGRGKSFITRSGKRLHADLAFMCIGIKPNSGPVKRSFPESVDERGRVVVNADLQVKGHGNVFSAGDINSWNEEKTAQNAERQARVVIHNIMALERGKAMMEYDGRKTPIVISLGDNYGIFEWGSFSHFGLIPAILKRLIEWMTMRRYS